ncbi:unnamed protein product [Closterium sp. NIES-64]|nr:unnamed protein product [Closterium sp. NIES-64]CAI6001091.1 unnamed protein product [Closterium sp. NIES-64]
MQSGEGSTTIESTLKEVLSGGGATAVALAQNEVLPGGGATSIEAAQNEVLHGGGATNTVATEKDVQSGKGPTTNEATQKEVLSGGGATISEPTQKEVLSGGGLTAEAEEGTPELQIPLQPRAVVFTASPSSVFMYRKPDRIDEGLYLGSLNSASNREALLELGIKSVVTVANDTGAPPFPDTFSYTLVHVADAMHVDLTTHFEGCFEAIEEGRRAGGVLVHCLADTGARGGCHVDLTAHFEGCFKAIEEGRKAGGVLVQCLAGRQEACWCTVWQVRGWFPGV